MTVRSSKWLAAALALGGAAPGWAAGAPTPAAFISSGIAADAPAGFLDLCRRDQTLCRAGLPAAASSVMPGDCARAGPVAYDPDLAPLAALDEPRAGTRITLRFDGVACTIGTQMAAASPPVIGLPLPGATGLGTAALVPLPRTARPPRGVAADAIRPGTIEPARLIRLINAQVNQQVVPVPDIASHGVEEEWDRPGRIGRPAGDCEDYAIEKRMRLVEAGFAADRLFFAVVYRGNLGLHTVLVARMSDGDYVLDSARPQVERWSRTGYSFLRVQSPEDPMRWSDVGNATRAS